MVVEEGVPAVLAGTELLEQEKSVFQHEEVLGPWKISALSEQPQPEYGSVFRQRRSTVALSSMESLKRLMHVINILSAGSLTSQQMVLNSPCLTYIKNWLVQIRRSLFWTTVAVKKVNDITRLQALIDKKKVVVTKASIRDAEGIECLPNEEIFAELARMGYEKPSTKLTFYKAFFSSQYKFLIHTILQYVNAAGVAAEWVVSASDDVNAVVQEQSIPSPTPPTLPPQLSQDIPSTS
nr:hypothetical protein [Tanacetum cinerariifolium]